MFMLINYIMSKSNYKDEASFVCDVEAVQINTAFKDEVSNQSLSLLYQKIISHIEN